MRNNISYKSDSNSSTAWDAIHDALYTHTYDHLWLLHFCLHAQLCFYSFIIRYWKSPWVSDWHVHLGATECLRQMLTWLRQQLQMLWAFLNYDLWNAQSTKIARYFCEKFSFAHVSILVHHWGSQMVMAFTHKPDGMVVHSKTHLLFLIPHLQWIYKD